MEHLMISATVKIKAKFDWRGSKRVADVFMEGCVCVLLNFLLSSPFWYFNLNITGSNVLGEIMVSK